MKYHPGESYRDELAAWFDGWSPTEKRFWNIAAERPGLANKISRRIDGDWVLAPSRDGRRHSKYPNGDAPFKAEGE